MKIHVLHCITSLHPDGAQQMLKRLIEYGDHERFKHTIVSLRERLPFAEALERAGANVVSLNMRHALPSLRAFLDLRSIITRERPQVIHSWLYHACCLSTLAVKSLRSQTPLIWGVRSSLDPHVVNPPLTKAIIALSARLSKRADAIIFNSHNSCKQHQAIGYAGREMRAILNGFDSKRFAPSSETRAAVRGAHQIPPNAKLIGCAGRFHPTKNFAGFLEAFSELCTHVPESFALMVGPGLDTSNPTLAALLKAHPYKEKIRAIGPQKDLAQILPALDVFCSTSLSEGFPNVIAEALLCGVPCAVTDVGTSRELVDGHGVVVAPAKNSEMRDALQSLLAQSPESLKALGQKGREKMVAQFDIQAITREYQALYLDLIPN